MKTINKEYSFLFIFVICLLFFGCRKVGDNNSSNQQNQPSAQNNESSTQSTNSSDDLRKKELELKEKELQLKEKELNQNSSDNFGGEPATINDPDGYTNIRSGPGINYSIIGIIKQDEEFYAKVNFKNDWWEVKSNGVTGYVHKSRIVFYADKKQNNTGRNITTSTPGRYPEASDRYLNKSDVSYLSRYDLKIMRNEIFARYGYIFITDDMRNYFQKQSWYIPRYDDVNNMLNQMEKANIELIKKYEK